MGEGYHGCHNDQVERVWRRDCESAWGQGQENGFLISLTASAKNWSNSTSSCRTGRMVYGRVEDRRVAGEVSNLRVVRPSEAWVHERRSAEEGWRGSYGGHRGPFAAVDERF